MICSSSFAICCNNLLFFSSSSFSCVWTWVACSWWENWEIIEECLVLTICILIHMFWGTVTLCYLHLLQFLSQCHLSHVWRRLLIPNVTCIIVCATEVVRAGERHKMGMQVVGFSGCGENLKSNQREWFFTAFVFQIGKIHKDPLVGFKVNWIQLSTCPHLYSLNVNSVQLSDLLSFASVCGFQNVFQMPVRLVKVSFLRLKLRNLFPKIQSTIQKHLQHCKT